MEVTKVKPIQVERLELTDVQAMEQLSQKRNAGEYTPAYIKNHPYLLPINVDRFLFSPEAMADVRQTAQVLQIEDAHFKIIKHPLLCSTADEMTACFVPLHVATSFCYKGMRVTGRYFVSFLHTVISSLPESLWSEPWAADLQEVRQALSPQERQALLEYFMRTYLESSASFTDLTVIAIPSRPPVQREKSPTHKAFMNLVTPCSAANECIITLKGNDMYLFTHTREEQGVQEVRETLADQNFLQQLALFFWSDHILQRQQAIVAAEMKSAELMVCYYQQFYHLLEWLRVTWKKAASG